MARLIWLPIAVILSRILAAVFWLVWQDGRRGPSAYVFATAAAAQEAGSCLALAERAQGLLPQQAVVLAAFLRKTVDCWRGGSKGAGRAALRRDPWAAAGWEGACPKQGLLAWAVALFGFRFASIDLGSG